MLILTRKPGESVYIGENVKVTVVEVKGNQIRLGIDAPNHIRIYREEIWVQILEENKKAAATAGELSDELAGLAEQWKGRKPQGDDGADAERSKRQRALGGIGQPLSVPQLPATPPKIEVRRKKGKPTDE